jgi:hypothetical protein
VAEQRARDEFAAVCTCRDGLELIVGFHLDTDRHWIWNHLLLNLIASKIALREA